MGSRRRRRRSNEISRYNLNEYVRKRVEAIENNPFAFSYSTPTASYRGRYVEKVEDSYASLASYAYRGDSVVAACMRVRRDLFRQAKFCWREIDEAGPGKIFRTDELDLLDNPWPNGTTGELLARMITDTDLCGNSFIHHDGDRLRWLRPDWVSIVLSGDPQADPDIDVLGYVYTPGGLDPDKNGVAYSPDDICHWAPEQDPLAFYRGMSWVSKALEEVQGDRAATTHKVAFFRNGATLGPIVRVPAGTSMQQFKEFMAAAEEAHAGAHNAYKTMYLGGGADVTLAAADFRQLDLKSVQGGMETRIAAVAGVHPVLVGLSEGLAGSSLNSGNFAAARRATAEMTLYSLWQDACGALQAFFKVPDQAELWIRERDIPFLREEARDRAEIFKTQVLAIEAAMRAGFKPDPAVKATLEERLDLLIGNHTGLFSVQMQPPQLGMPGAPPLDVNGDGQPDEPGAPIDFGALRAGAWWFDPEDIERGVEAMFDGVELDDVLERSYNPEQARIPKGFEGGGRFRKLSDRLVALLNDWAKGEGDDDPLDEYSRDQLRRVAKELADKARADGDNERAARLTPRRGASSDEIKLALYKDVRAHVRGERDRKADEPKRQAKFTLQNGEFHDKDVAVYRLPGDKPALFYESDAGRRGGLVERFDDLDGLAAWADEHGETRLAEWARKEGGRKAPDADVRESALGSTRKTQGQLDAEHRAREERIAAQEKDPVDLRKRAMTARKRANQAVRDGRDGEAREQLATAAEFDRRANAIQPMTDDELAQYGRDLALYETDAGRRRLLADARKARTRGPEVAPASGRPTAVLSTEELSDIRAAVSDMENEGQRAAARRALRLAQDGDAEGFIAQARYNAKTLRADADKNPERFYRHNLREQAKVWDQLADKAEARSRKADADVPHPAEQAARVNALRAIATSNDDYALRKRRLDREIPDSKAELTALAEDGGWTRALKGKGDLRDRLVDVILDDPDGNNPRVPAPARTPQLRGTDFSERGDPGTEQDLHAYMVKAGDEVLIGGTWERVGKNWAYGGHRVIERPDGSLIDDTTLDTATVRVRIGADHLDVHPREQAARDRQARYDRQRAVAKPLAHTLSALDMEASDRALRNRIEGQSKAAGTPDEVRDRLLAAVGNRDQLRETVRDLEREHGLTRIGDTDEVVPFDGMAHESISPDVRRGQKVTVLRPGYQVEDDNGRKVTLESAQVQDLGPHGGPDAGGAPRGEGVPAAPRGKRMSADDVFYDSALGDPGTPVALARQDGTDYRLVISERDGYELEEFGPSGWTSTGERFTKPERLPDLDWRRPPAPTKKAPGAPTMSEAGGIGDGTQTYLRPVSTAGTTPLAERVAEQLKSGEITPTDAAAMLGATGTEAPGRAAAKVAGPKAADLPDASDPEALRDALDLRTVDQLKTMLRERGLPVSGRKRELVDRLVDAPTGALVAKTAGAKARAADNSAIVGALRGGGSEGEYIRALAADPSLTSTRLRAVAADLGINVPDGMRAKTALQLHIASEAARKFGPGDGSLVDRMPTPGASKAFDAASMAERLTRLNDEGQDFSAELKGVTSIANARKLATALNISAPSTPHPTRKDFFGTAIKVPKKMTLAEWRKYIAEQLGRSALRSGPPEAEDLIRAGEVDVEDLEDEDYDDEPDLEDMQAVAAMDAEVERAAGHDVTPGHDELHHYWTRGEGLAKWADSPRPWTTLVAHLVKHVGERKARIFASRWFIEVFGFAAGSDMNRVTHGKPPRGQVVGPG